MITISFLRQYDVPIDAITTDSSGRVKRKKRLDKKAPEDKMPLTASRPSIYDEDIDPYATTQLVNVRERANISVQMH